MRNYRGMPPRTAVISFLVDTTARKPVESLDLAGIQQARTITYPKKPPFSWVTGVADPAVGITFGTAPARDGYEIPLRIYRPHSLKDTTTDVPVIIYYHGGGWVLGNLVNYDPICTDLAAGVGAVAISVDYRMAPEYRSPTAVEDAVDALSWVARHGEVLRADTSRIAVSGDSAGGHLSAVVTQILRDEGGPQVTSQALIYPATDLTMSSPSVTQHSNGSILTKASMDAFVDHYCPPGVDRAAPINSPLFGDLTGLPPALIQTADLDPIRDDGLRYAAKLTDAGVPVTVTNYRGVPHGFASIPGASALGKAQRTELIEHLRTHLRP